VPGAEPRIQVLERLDHARAILLMDNCEHVLDPIADAVTELGSTCGELFLINTSRRTLGVEGEAVYEGSCAARPLALKLLRLSKFLSGSACRGAGGPGGGSS
jgi:predicted ATPase